MSTTDTISPYEPSNSDNSLAAGIAAGVAGATIAAGYLLVGSLRYDEKQKAAVERFREEEREKRLQMSDGVALDPTRVTLRLRTAEPLVMSAEGLGFKLSPLEKPHMSLEAQPQLVLSNASGESLIIQKNKGGRLIIQTTSDLSVIQKVVRKHTIDRAVDHLNSKCANLKVQPVQDGEVVLVGSENKIGLGGKAKITAHIKKDGEITLDVSNIKGKRCETIIKEMARAVGGESVKTSRKKEYFQEVEEKEKVRV